MRWLRLGLVGAVLLVGGLTLDPAAGQSANKQVNVTGSAGAYAFQAGAVPSGQTVLWENHSDTNHNVSIEGTTRAVPSGDGARSQPFQVSGAPRVINYSCTIHTNMTGQLQVSEPVATTTTTATTTRPATATTTRAATTSTRRGATTTSGAAAVTSTTDTTFLDTTTSESTTSTTSAPLAIKEASKGGGTSSAAIAGILAAIVAVLGGGAYALYRLRANGP